MFKTPTWPIFVLLGGLLSFSDLRRAVFADGQLVIRFSREFDLLFCHCVIPCFYNPAILMFWNIVILWFGACAVLSFFSSAIMSLWHCIILCLGHCVIMWHCNSVILT